MEKGLLGKKKRLSTLAEMNELYIEQTTYVEIDIFVIDDGFSA